MIQIGDTWEIGRTVYYVDDKDKTLVKEARIKEVHEEILREEPRPLGKVVSYKKTLFLDNGDEISIQNAFTSKEEALGEPKNCDGNLNFSLNISILVT